MTVQHHKFQLVLGLFDNSAENIVTHTEYRLKVSTIHVASDQWFGVEHYLWYITFKSAMACYSLYMYCPDIKTVVGHNPI